MTREDFEALVLSYAKAHGQQYIQTTEVAKLREFLNRMFTRICAEHKLIYDDNITFTVTSSSTGIFDLRDTDVFGKQIIACDQVVVNSNLLRRLDGTAGGWSVDELTKFEEQWRTASANEPQAWAARPPHHIRLYPRPDATYSNSAVAGWITHPDITASGFLDTTELSFAPEDCEPIARYCVAELLLPYADGTSLEKAMQIKALAEKELDAGSSRAGRMYQGPFVRGKYRRRVYHLN